MEGWNDPPKNVGMPTGNLKINLNKRVAFPLSQGQTQNTSASPLLLPPRPPSTTGDQSTDPIGGTSKVESLEDDTNSQRENVLRVLNEAVEELSSAVQSTVASKLKTLEEDWNHCDVEMRQILLELCQNLEAKDAKSAAANQRRIVMKGCSKPWLHAIRQIVMHLETSHGADEVQDAPLDLTMS